MEQKSTAAPSVYTHSDYKSPSTGSSARNGQHLQGSTYLSYHDNGARPPTQPVIVAQLPARTAAPAPPSTGPTGTLLLVVSGSPDPLLRDYVQRALERANMSEVAVLGSKVQEVPFKQLKMDLYGIAGNMRRELGVYTYLEDELSAAVVEVVIEKIAAGNQITGVICNLEDTKAGENTDILDLDTQALERSWRSTVGLLHAVAKQTIPQMARRDVGQTSGTSSGFFLSTSLDTLSPAITIHRTAAQALLDDLAKSYAGSNFVVGYVEQIFIAEPEQEPVKARRGPQLAHINGWNDGSDDISPSESPTKLWHFWTLQNEINVAD